MLTPTQNRSVILLGIWGFIACVAAAILLSRKESAEFIFPVSRQEAITTADRFIPSEYRDYVLIQKETAVDSDQAAIIYLQERIGVQQTNALLRSFPLYYWRVTSRYRDIHAPWYVIFNRTQTKQFEIRIDPITDKVVYYHDTIVSSAPFESDQDLSREQALVIVGDFCKTIGFELKDFDVVRFSTTKKKSVYELEFEKGIPVAPFALEKVTAIIYGDRISSFRYAVDIPNNLLAEVTMKSATQDFLLAFVLNFAVFGFGLYVFIMAMRKRRELAWRFGMLYAAISIPTVLLDLAHVQQLSTVGLRALVAALLLFVGCISLGWTAIVATMSEYFSRQSQMSLARISRSKQIEVSYVFVFASLGSTLFMFGLIAQFVTPITTLGFYSFFSHYSSQTMLWLLPPLIALSAGLSEELFFRALLITFLKKHCKTFTLPILISACVWAFIHISPFGYQEIHPSVLKGLVLLPVGIIFGYIFVRFGLVAAMVTHYLYDLFVISLSLFEFTNYSRAPYFVFFMLIAGMVPLIIAVASRKKNRIHADSTGSAG